MFDDVQEPKDMFADSLDDVPQASQGVSDHTPAQVRQNEQPQVLVPEVSHAPQGGIIRLIAFLVISFLCVGGAGYAVYRFMVQDAVPQQVSEVVNNPPVQAEVPDESTDNKPVPGTPAVIDSDGDGLSNEEERIAGTSVANPDTDEDGLGDKEEVRIYKTDPKKKDTDGDGYGDGEEVKNGYHPNGEGRWLQMPQ